MATKNCSICLEDIDDTGKFLDCTHCFHEQCINTWLQKSNTCPECRNKTNNEDTTSANTLIKVSGTFIAPTFEFIHPPQVSVITNINDKSNDNLAMTSIRYINGKFVIDME